MNDENNITANGLQEGDSAAFVSQPENVGTINDPEIGFSNSFSEQEHEKLPAVLVATQNMKCKCSFCYWT